jgi:3'-5' exoribonuclease
VAPLTREALLLAMIDDMDAKMNMVDKALVDVLEGEFTSRIFTLDDRTFYKAKK